MTHAWAAGFFEADGSIFLKQFYHPSESVRPWVTATQNDPAPLERLVELYGGGILQVKTPKGKPHWRWRLIKSVEIEYFATCVWPYMTPGPKRDKIKIAYHMVPCIIGEGCRSYGRQRRRKKLEATFRSL